MRTPFWLERPRRPDLQEPSLPAEGLDGLELLDEAAVLEEPSFHPSEDALQEIAEQTPYGEILLEDLIRRQLRLAISVAGVFLVVLFGLPLMSLLFPDLVTVRVLGLPMSWLALAVLIYPFLWTLAVYFVSTSRKYEDEFTEIVK